MSAEPIKCDIKYDDAESCRIKINQLREAKKLNKMKDINYRIGLLELLLKTFCKYEEEIHRSNFIDLGESKFLSEFTTFYFVKNEIEHAISNLKDWVSPVSRDVPLIFPFASSYVKPEPFGICLIMGAWNCNFLSVINPLVGAIASGNLSIVKPAASSPETCKVCMKILAELPKEAVLCCAGSPEVYTELLKNRFDLIVFTGSAEKGKLIAKAAAEYLTPTILELGGQNPVIVEKTADLEFTALGIVSGRMTMNGQMCIAPEYVMIDKTIYDKVVKEIQKKFTEFYGDADEKCTGLGRMINKHHTERILNLVNEASSDPNAKLIWGDIKKSNLENRFISPLVFGFDSLESMSKSCLAKDEIFGPVLYLAPYEKLEDAVGYINEREKPLSCYLFTENDEVKEYVRDNTSSGCLDINDTLVHFAHPDLPFGGVGNSGMGAHHGKSGFTHMSHWKPVVNQRNFFKLGMRYPPYVPQKTGKMILALKWLMIGRYSLLKKILYFGAIVIIIVFRFLLGYKIRLVKA